VDCIVDHLSLSIDLLIYFDYDSGFFVEFDSHLFLVICFVVGICLVDEIYLLAVTYLANVIDI
jgi:hypothetical protein